MLNEARADGSRRQCRRARAVLGLARAAAVMVATAAPLAVGASTTGETQDLPARHVWLDARGQPLPFQENAEIEEFLRTARVVDRDEIGVGINKLDKLRLEKGGVEAHAVFRVVDVEENEIRVEDRLYLRFKDSWAGECAAYAVARLLGIAHVPPTVERLLDGSRGSMQIWVEEAHDPTADGFRPPGAIAWVQQTWGMTVFDNLIFNADRNAGNMLADEQYTLWLIDHTRAFQPVADLLSPDKLERVRRRVWTRLLEISEEELADATREYLDAGQVTALKERRTLLVEHIQALIDEKGEGTVLY